VFGDVFIERDAPEARPLEKRRREFYTWEPLEELEQRFVNACQSVVKERDTLGPMLKFRLFQHLPARLWFQAVTEESQRWETNVYQTSYKGRNDYVFRSLPNITLGYALTERTNIYTNFFVIKDIYAAHGALDSPTTISTSMGIRRDFPVTKRTVLQFDMQARELWQAAHLHQADLFRLSMSKPNYGPQIDQLKKQLQEKAKKREEQRKKLQERQQKQQENKSKSVSDQSGQTPKQN